VSKSQTLNEPEKSTKPVLWVVTELYYPENNQTGYYMTGIAEGLADEFEVKVICGQPNYAAKGTRAARREFHQGVEIFRVWGTTLDKNVILFRLLNMLTLGASIFLKSLVKIKSRQLIIVVSAPPSLPFITALAAKIRRARYNLIVQDKYPETLIAVGKTHPDSMFVKIFNKLNVWLYREAERIIVVGRDMGELVKTQMNGNPVHKTKIEVIQNWASLEEIEPTQRDNNDLLKELGIAEKFVFLYAGNMGHPQDLESIVECAVKLKNDERFHFLFLGSGVKRKWLETKVEETDLRNVTVIPPRPRAEQKLFLNACDVGFVSLVKGMRGVAMPSRTYNFLAAGKPILALTEEDSEVARVIEEDQVGWTVAPNEPAKLLQIVYKIYNERDLLGEISKRARKSALDKYSVEIAVNKYKKSFIFASDNLEDA
jgi:glycosyltransferase involved in cell wall biosynthesis